MRTVSIIAPVLVEQLLHDFPVIMHAFIAGEVAELDVIVEEIDLDPAADEGERHCYRIDSILIKAEMNLLRTEKI
jgi:hypothetical protein